MILTAGKKKINNTKHRTDEDDATGYIALAHAQQHPPDNPTTTHKQKEKRKGNNKNVLSSSRKKKRGDALHKFLSSLND